MQLLSLALDFIYLLILFYFFFLNLENHEIFGNECRIENVRLKFLHNFNLKLFFFFWLR
jgi:hypothetical protein